MLIPTAVVEAAGGGQEHFIVRKTADQSLTADTNLQNDTHLLFAIGASEIWSVQYYLRVDGATGGDIKLHVNGPSGVDGWFGVEGPGTGAGTFVNMAMNNEADVTPGSGLAPIAGTLGASAFVYVKVVAMVVNGATPGNVTLQWAQATSSGTATRVMANSYLIAHRVA